MLKQNKLIQDYHKMIFLGALAIAILYVLDFIEYNMLLPGDINVKWVIAILLVFDGWMMYELYLEGNNTIDKTPSPYSRLARTQLPKQYPQQMSPNRHLPEHSQFNSLNTSMPQMQQQMQHAQQYPTKMPRQDLSRTQQQQPPIKFIQPNLPPQGQQAQVPQSQPLKIENDALPEDLARDLGLTAAIEQPAQAGNQSTVDKSQYVSENNPFKHFGFEQ